jgi:dTDP-glucose pyrophosphorylase/CBS domain-containing protein
MRSAEPLFVPPSALLREVVACIDRNQEGIALVVDDDRRLVGTVTDGDVRRALLAGAQLDAMTAGQLIEQKAPATRRQPVTAPVGATPAELLDLMNQHELRHIPLVGEDGRVAGIELLTSLVHDYELPIRALVMAGGYGTRLRPLTDDRPKSMLPVGDRPLLEHIVEQLQQAGIKRVHLATHYKAEAIAEHFGDGHRFGVEINYINEDAPLGTAGALALMADSEEPLLVMNGDILSDVNVASMVDFHRTQGAALTIAVRPYDVQVPFGVVRVDGMEVIAVEEKPIVTHLVNAGIYVLQPGVCRLVPSGRPFDMTDLIAASIDARLRVISFPLREYWLDIGRADDYVRARAKFGEGHARS